nr:hypothetical protein GCM10020185_16090 [Pseudomonas brassicacearum subsp. brassicacearum]
MKITPILTQLREQCPTLAHRVAAGFDLATLQAETPLQTPCAYVLPTADIASKNAAQNVTLQAVRDRFDAVLVLDATDATKALDLLHDLRAELWRALVGFKPGAEYTGVEYDGSELVSINSSRVLYRLRFFSSSSSWAAIWRASLPKAGTNVNWTACRPLPGPPCGSMPSTRRTPT